MDLNRRWEELMRRGEALAEDKDPVVRHQLEEIREFYESLEAEYAAVLDRWEERRRARASSPRERSTRRR
jgi:hypothetical protein